ncbi:MAG: hypothetical protein QM734_12315 [Cyclobacteriaceae bacterium]
MKKTISLLSLALLLGASFYFVSCSKSSDPGPQILLPKTDGFYVFGTNTVASGPTDSTARMNVAVLDHSQGAGIDNLPGVYGRLIYIGANSTISFAKVVNEKGTTYGADKGGTYDSASKFGNSTIKDKVYGGTLKANGQAINITEEGLYYAFVKANTDTMIYTLMKVAPNMIGDITSWNSSYALPVKSASVDSTVFEGLNIPMRNAFGYKYRIGNGWQVYTDPNIVTLTSLGVPDYGAAWASGINDIGFYNDNIPHPGSDGSYTLHVVYNAITNTWKEVKVRTGDLFVDYTNAPVGLEGNAYVYAPSDTGAWAGNGTDGYDVKKPVVSGGGKIFTWTWSNVNLIQDREFIFLQAATWGAGLQVDYSSATVNGTAISGGGIVDATAAPYSEPYHNFRVVTGGAYDITLKVDESSGSTVKTVTINTH